MGGEAGRTPHPVNEQQGGDVADASLDRDQSHQLGVERRQDTVGPKLRLQRAHVLGPCRRALAGRARRRRAGVPAPPVARVGARRRNVLRFSRSDPLPRTGVAARPPQLEAATRIGCHWDGPLHRPAW